MTHQELGYNLLKRVEADLLPHGVVEQFPKMEGRQMVMVLAPKKKELVKEVKPAKPKAEKIDVPAAPSSIVVQ